MLEPNHDTEGEGPQKGPSYSLGGQQRESQISHLLHELYTWAPKYKHIIISYLKKIKYPL
jgi:hypothetical protein